MKTLTREDYLAAAALLRTGVAEVKTLADVESGRAGFLKDGRLVIRFEGHKFREHTRGKYDKAYPTLSHPYMKKCPYNKGVKSDYLRLAVAIKLDATAALMSCSWGMFQQMGNEYWRSGFKNVHEFVDAMKTGERAQLLAIGGFLISKKLDDDLRTHNWPGLAYGYNGENHEDNDYVGQLTKRFAINSAQEAKLKLAEAKS